MVSPKQSFVVCPCCTLPHLSPATPSAAQYVTDLIAGMTTVMDGPHIGPFNVGNPGTEAGPLSLSLTCLASHASLSQLMRVFVSFP